ncbi:hypothetical protein Tco_1062986 [Tanacetum coccineum]
MLSLSCAASKLATVVIALFILSPPPYGQPYLLHDLEAHKSEFDVLQFGVLQLGSETFGCEVEGVGWGSGGVVEPSPSGAWFCTNMESESGVSHKYH